MPKTMETTLAIMLNSPQKTMVMASLADSNNKKLGNTPAEIQETKSLLTTTIRIMQRSIKARERILFWH
ncbi:hypothetical protein BSPWISOXPB_4083 [uncultured Gammaproteobacteria bacterium]|nr:hypothetical protein BSPWISOXPB_4083 [uncultured Gammaproteobacteria bacterium]